MRPPFALQTLVGGRQKPWEMQSCPAGSTFGWNTLALLPHQTRTTHEQPGPPPRKNHPNKNQPTNQQQNKRLGKRQSSTEAPVFAAEDVAAAELQPFRYAGVDSQTSTEFKWVVWKEPAHITLVYAWTISGGVTGKSGKQRKRKAASGLGALLAALRHHHGPDDTAQLEVGTDYQEWRRVDSGSGTAEERLTAIEYLEKRLGVASGGSWQGALEVVSLPDMRHTCSPPPALVRLLSSTCSPPPALPCLLSSTCSPPPALPCLLSSTCSPPPALPCLLSSTCSPPPALPSPALLRLLSSACSPPPALLRLLSSACSPPPALLRLLSSACSPLLILRCRPITSTK